MIDPARLTAEALHFLPRKGLSRTMGLAAELRGGPISSSLIAAFIRAYDVDMSEAVVPAGGYRTFNEFFTRTLVPGARPVDDDLDTVVSPADGRVEDIGDVDTASTLMVKGRRYEVGELLGDASEAARYAGGTFFIVYLSPRDYHRVHAPVSGPLNMLRYVPGTLYPVNRIGLEYVPNLFARNERVAMVQEGPFGRVTTVMVGAIGVGHISVTFDDVETNVGQTAGQRDYGADGPPMERGEELGTFHIGSTAIVFVEPEHPLDLLIEPGTHVRVGQALLRRRHG